MWIIFNNNSYELWKECKHFRKLHLLSKREVVTKNNNIKILTTIIIEVISKCILGSMLNIPHE